MPVPDPAERRTVIRGAIECAIGLNSSTRNGQTKPLTAAVWRVIEPQLTQRDDQLTAVRDILAAMDDVTGARMWAEQLHTALRTRPGALPPIAWCGASMTGYGADPIGPCVLRHGHDGPVHQAANGAKWWPEQTLTVRDLTPPRLISAPLLDDADPPINLGALLDTRQFGEITADSIDPAVTHPEPLDGAGIWEAIVRLYGGLFPPQCRAEYRDPVTPAGRCRLAEGHDGQHRDAMVGPDGLDWDDTVAMYPTTTPEDDQ